MNPPSTNARDLLTLLFSSHSFVAGFAAHTFPTLVIVFLTAVVVEFFQLLVDIALAVQRAAT